jgi:hypothetical protein
MPTAAGPARVTGLASSSSDDWTHLPAGFSPLTDYGFTDAIPSGTGAQVGTSAWYVNNTSGDLSQVSNQTGAPISAPTAAKWSFPEGFGDGGAGLMYADFAQTGEAFFAFSFQASSPLEPNGGGARTLAEVASPSAMHYATLQIPSGGTAFQLYVTNAAGSLLAPTSTPINIALGAWHKLEWYMKYSSSANSADGVIRWWIDGTLQGDYVDQNMPADGGFGEYRLDARWDGATKSIADSIEFDHVYVAKPGGAICEATGGAHCYYIMNQAGTGTGSFSDPFRLGDLPDTTTAYCGLTSAALNALNPGDYLYFRGGSYQLHSCYGPQTVWSIGYIRPARSGTSSQPITIKAYPTESVTLTTASGDQPVLGADSKSYVHFSGFTVTMQRLLTGFHSGIETSTGLEVSYMDIVGDSGGPGDINHDGIRLQKTSNPWIHHNVIHGVQGANHNHAGIKLYNVSNALIEDNYFHHNTAGVYDKEGAVSNVYRHNFFTANANGMATGSQNVPSSPAASYQVYDNVFDNWIKFFRYNDGAQIHDNLIRDDTLTSSDAAQDDPPYSNVNAEIWNNIIISGTSQVVAYRAPWDSLSTTTPKRQFAYYDYNFYDAAPTFRFAEYVALQQLSLSDMRGYGYASHDSVTTASTIFANQSTYQLNSAWLTKGRDQSAPGPDNTWQILTLTRYGPTARPSP